MAVKNQLITDHCALYNGDCIQVMAGFPDHAIDLSVYSPPFATSSGGLYTYSSSERDLSNSPDYQTFFEHYAFVVRELYRITKPGRMSAVHCMDIPSGNSGNDYRIDFPGDIIRLYERSGWRFVARYAVWKEPLTVRNRTLMKALFHETICEDSTKCNNAAADYLLVFRRKGTNPVPVTHPTGLLTYAGERRPPNDILHYRGHTGRQIENLYSHWIWRQYASAFWDDIRLDRVLPFREAKDEEDEKHVHPLQLDVIERCVQLWSNPGETVFTPFMGVGSEVYQAILSGRKGVGVELKPSYYSQAVKNVRIAIDQNGFTEADDQEDLFAQIA